ncbi:MAG: hypothetical protein AAGK23_09580 [Pseudomonadota bacterium]
MLSTFAIRAILAIWIVGFTATSASAREENIIGSWSFETDRYRADTCVLYGSMQVRPTAEEDIYRCTFTAVEDCDGQDRWVVEQTCRASRDGDNLAIQSTIVNFLEFEQHTENYAPDHFALAVESANKMVGTLVSAIRAKVTFERTPDTIS